MKPEAIPDIPAWIHEINTVKEQTESNLLWCNCKIDTNCRN